MALKTDWKDDIFSGNRKYQLTNNTDGTVSLEDKTAYTQTGDAFGANELNGICAEINTELEETKKSVSDGKTLLAAAITAKKVAAAATETFAQLAAKIGQIVLGSGNAAAADVLAGKTFTNSGGIELTGTMANRGAIAQALSINGTYTVPVGYHNGAGKVTQSIATLGAQNITPGTSAQIVAISGKYGTGNITVSGDSNLVAANIRAGKSIFGVTGGCNYFDKINESFRFDGTNLSSSTSTTTKLTITSSAILGYTYVLVYWGCAGGGVFAVGGVGSTSDRFYLDFTGGIVYKLVMYRASSTSIELQFTKVYGSGYGIMNTGVARIVGASNVSFI